MRFKKQRLEQLKVGKVPFPVVEIISCRVRSGSLAAAAKWILSVCSGEIIAERCC